jgi:signal transduction histidine kinase
MRYKAVLVTACLLYCIPSFSQTNNIHPGVKTSSGSSPRLLNDMLADLGKAATPIQKANVLYNISKHYADRMKVDSALFYSEKIRQESQAGNYEKGIAKYYLSKSYALYLRMGGDIPELIKAVDIFLREKDNWFIGFTYRQLARQHERRDEYAISREYYRKSAHFLSKTDDINNLQWVYNEMAKNFYKTYEPDSTIYYALKGLDLAEKINMKPSVVFASTVIAEMHFETGNMDKANWYIKYAYDRRDSARKPQMLELLPLYARFLLHSNDFEQAELVIKEYETVNKQLGGGWGNTQLVFLRGMFQYHKGNYPEALTILRHVYDRKADIGDFGYDLKNIYSYLANAEYHSGLYNDAIRHFTELQDLALQLSFGPELLSSTQMLARCYARKGSTDSAYYHMLAYDRYKDSIMEFRKERAMLEMTTRYETEKKEQQISLLQREKELSEYELRSEMDEIEKQNLLETSKKNLAFENQQKEILKKQGELALLEKESQLQAVIAIKETQRKKFAYIAIAAILFFSGYVVYRYIQNRKLSARLQISLVELKQMQAQLIRTEKEKEADNIRVRISRDIHDEVGATLSGVALFSEIAREKMKQRKDDDAQIYLEHITANSKEMVDKMSDIVWAINPDNDSLERIIAKLRSYAFNLCAGKGISFDVKIDDAIREYFPPMQVKKNLYLLIKEAINNSVKYSEGKNISLSLGKSGQYFIAEIKDDGKGFDNFRLYEGNGIKNMNARANLLEGKLTIDSQKDKGTAISLRFLFQPAEV